MNYKSIFLVLLVSLITMQAYSKEKINEDSIRVYKLGQIVVTDKNEITLLPTSIKNISYTKIAKTDANSFKSLAQIIPSSHIQLTSRGDESIFLRGVGDRRLGLFLDGVPVNEPWDRRFSISMIPTEVIGNISASNGSASILYGANTMAGALDITTIEKQNEGFSASLKASGATAHTMNLSFTGDGRIGDFNFIANISYLTSDGIILPKSSYDKANSLTDSTMLNQNDGSHIRTNTDIERMNIFLRGEYDLKFAKVGLSFIRIQGDYGIAALGYEIDKPRFWRFPKYDRNLASLHYTQYLNEDKTHNIKAVAWYDGFLQSIDEYEDISYKTKSANTEDVMGTVGTRISYNVMPAENQWLTAMASVYSAANTETIQSLGSDTTEFDYSEVVYDLGLEYRINLIDKLVISAGVLYSGQNVPKAGEFTAQDNTSHSGFGGVFGAKYNFNEASSLFANVSKKMSYPALRESFANPPKKFYPNPDLGPENGILSELGYEMKFEKWALTTTAFYNTYTDMIEKNKIAVNGKNYDQRVNLSEAYFVGLEAAFSVYPIDNLDIFGTVSYIYSQKKMNENSDWDNLAYVPEIVANMTVRYRLPFSINVQLEADYLGKQYDDVDYNEIDPTLMLNFRLSYNLPFNSIGAELFLRANNLTDEERITTLGLPEAGRTIFAGFSINI